jgi:UbiD family decarboxylase
MVKILRERFKKGIPPLPPVEVNSGPVMENVHTGDEIDLFEFPTPKWHKQDGGRYIGTGNLVIQKDPDEGWVNIGTYRVQVQDRNTATIYIGPSRHGNIIRKKYWEKGLPCPVVVVCGCDPLLWTAGSTPLPWGSCEFDYIGGLRNKPVEIIKGKFTGLPIPATAEIVLEGELLPPGMDDRQEGPFAEYTGYYASGARTEPGFRVKCLMHRNDPIILGNPPAIGKYVNNSKRYVDAAILWNEMDKKISGVKGVWYFCEAGAEGVVVISIKQLYAGHAKSAALFAAGAHTQSQACRWVIVVDDDIDPTSFSDILWVLGQRSDPEMGLDIIKGLSANPLNPMASPEMKKSGNHTHSRAILLACKPYEWIKEFPISVKSKPEDLEPLRKKWGKTLYGQS